MSVAASKARERGIALGVMVVLLTFMQVAIPLAENTWIYRDGRFYVNVNENILDAGSLEDPFAHSWYSGELGWNRNLPAGFSNIALGRDGEFYSFRPWLLPVLSTPLYWIFGLFGVLLFNLLGFGVAAYGAERFAREYAPPNAASLAALGLVLVGGTSARAYDYSVDVLLLALVCLALAALVTRRGLATGLLIGLAVLIKPPSILLALPCVLILWERGDKKTFLRAILGGAIALGLGGLMNTWMFGRPWWFGYSRVLVVENGVQAVLSDTDAFGTPWDVGLRDMWGGEWGVARRWGAFALCLVGHAALLRKHPRYVLGSIGTLVALFLLFSRFEWRYDRFLFGAFALQVPALAAGLHQSARGVLAALRRMRRRLHPTALMAAILAILGALASFGTSPPPAERLSRGAYAIGAITLGAGGTLDLGELPAAQLEGEHSVATRTRFGGAIARAPLPAVLTGGLAYALGGFAGLLILHLLLGGVLIYSMTRLASRAAPSWAAAVMSVGLSLLPPLAEAMIAGGPGLYAAALAALGLSLGARRRFVLSAILLGLSAWLADAFYLPLLLPLLWTYRDRRLLKRAGFALAATLGVYGLTTLIVIGRPFASPDDFVIVGHLSTPAAVSAPSLLEVLERAFQIPGPSRALLPLLFIAPFGALLAWRRDRFTGGVMVAALASALVPGAWTDGMSWTPLAALGLGLGGAVALGALPNTIGRISIVREGASPRQLATILATAALAFTVVGALSRASARSEPLRFASPRGVRHAEVQLGPAPCDFLAWELWSWECAVLDGGGEHRTGLKLPEGVAIDGRPLFLIPTAQRRPRAPRTVAWTLPTTDQLAVHAGAPAGPYDADAELIVRVDGDELDRIQIPRAQTRLIHRTYDTSTYAARSDDVRVELEMRMVGRGRSAAIAVDGGFE